MKWPTESSFWSVLAIWFVIPITLAIWFVRRCTLSIRGKQARPRKAGTVSVGEKLKMTGAKVGGDIAGIKKNGGDVAQQDVDVLCGAELKDTDVRGDITGLPQDVVNTGFAARGQPDRPLDPFEALARHEPYYFWIEVGRPIVGSIEETPTPLPPLPKEARITVTLFACEKEIEIVDPQLTGEFQIRPDGGVVVSRLADKPEGISADLANRRLFFAIITPATGGSYKFRCNFYCEQVLIQSRLVTVRVITMFQQARQTILERGRKDIAASVEPALRSIVDYDLSPSLSAEKLADLQPHCLSIMLNANRNGTHGLRIFGSDGHHFVKDNITLDGATLADLVDRPRRALKKISWGNVNDWDGTMQYLYDDEVCDYDRLTRDLARLAVAGFRTYAALISKLGGKNPAPMERAVRDSGLVQIALTESASFAVPAALFYDINWDTNAFLVDDPSSKFTLCETFTAALTAADPLEDCACFHGGCPVRARSDALRKSDRLIKELGPVICPSGFWGYRHALGLPLSVQDGPDVATAILFQQDPAMTIGIATNLKGWPAHEIKLHKLRPGIGWNIARTRDSVLKLLKTTKAHLIYFYCHGGLNQDAVPFLAVGSDEMNISPDQFLADAISWDNPRPLVFINGCRTTALTPQLALQFVNPFVQQAAAAGVIGTEITVFESMASTFAEECLQRFFDGKPIGEAVRGARLALVRKGNPLGLAYIPFVLPSLRLQQTPGQHNRRNEIVVER